MEMNIYPFTPFKVFHPDIVLLISSITCVISGIFQGKPMFALAASYVAFP